MAAEMLKKVMATENEAAENEKNAASEADKIIKKAKDYAEKLMYMRPPKSKKPKIRQRLSLPRL